MNVNVISIIEVSTLKCSLKHNGIMILLLTVAIPVGQCLNLINITQGIVTVLKMLESV